MYGTDASTGNGAEYMASLQQTMLRAISAPCSEAFPVPHSPEKTMRGFDLDAESQKNIGRESFFKFVGREIRPLDRALVREHARLIESIARKRGDEAVLRTTARVLSEL